MRNTNITLNHDKNNLRLAVLIDADNAKADSLELVLQKVESLGVPIIKRIYGDFSSSKSKKWRMMALNFGFIEVQQSAYTKGKNASDIAMVIDAMELLYTNPCCDGICLVTSDSDFTKLALKIREKGLVVYGFGEDKTPESFRNSCEFINTKNLTNLNNLSSDAKIIEESAIARNIRNKTSDKKKVIEIKADETKESLPQIIQNSLLNEKTDKWFPLSLLGKKLNIKFPCDGYSNLKKLVEDKALNLFETKQEPTKKDPTKFTLYVRFKRN